MTDDELSYRMVDHMKIILVATIAVVSSSYGVTILSEANFDGTNTLNAGNNGATLTVSSGGSAPTGSNGEVGIIDSGGTNVWGAVNPPGNILALPAGVVPGTDTFTATVRVFIPQTGAGAFTGTDRFNLIVRRNNTNGGGNAWATNTLWDAASVAGQWGTISRTETIPEFETDGVTPVTGLTPILSFYDRTDLNGAVQNVEAGAGISAYIDDWSFSVTTSAVPEPSSSMAALLGLGLLGLRRKR